MKVKNEYVQIEIGNKIYRHQNIILNEYLKRLFNSQINTIHDDCFLTRCFLKLDTPLENVNYNSQISPNEFDLAIYVAEGNTGRLNTETTSNYVRINYQFTHDKIFEVNGEMWTASILEQYVGRQIMGIGFGVDKTSNILAYLDTSSMNIIINSGESLNITRSDLLKSEGVCDGFDYPLHLVHDLVKYNETATNVTKAQLYSIGFGNERGVMTEEYLVGSVETDRDNTSITFSINKQQPSQYLIFKYRMYTVTNNNVQYINKYYTMSKRDESFGNLDIKLKIERA